MKNIKRKLWSWSSFFLGALVAALVTFIVHETKKEVVAWKAPSGSSPKGRSPASISPDNDFSGFQGEKLNYAAKQRILSGLDVKTDTQGSSIQMGNFVLLNDQNQKDFVCGLYNHVTLSLEAEGVAVSGEKPTLIVDAPCVVGNDINTLSPIKIPFQKIRAQNPKSRDLSLQQDGGGLLHIQAGNNSDSWPKQWSLKEINLTHDNVPSRILHINQDEIQRFANKPILMN